MKNSGVLQSSKRLKKLREKQEGLPLLFLWKGWH